MKIIKLLYLWIFASLSFIVMGMNELEKEKIEKPSCLSSIMPLDIQKIIGQYAYEWLLNNKVFKDSNIEDCVKTILSSNGQILASSHNFQIKLWDFNTKSCIDILNDVNNNGWMESLAFSHDNKYLATGRANGNIKIYDIENKKYIYNLDNPIDNSTEDERLSLDKAVFDLKYSHDDNILASVSQNKIKIWDLKTNNNIKTFDIFDSIYLLSFSRNKQFLASGNKDGYLQIWDLKAQKCAGTYGINYNDSNGITALQYSPNDQYIAIACGASIKIFCIATSTCINTFDNSNGGHSNIVTHLIYSHDGKFLISGCRDGLIKIWDLNNGNCIQTIDGSNGSQNDPIRLLDFSQNGMLIFGNLVDSQDCTKIQICSNRESELLSIN